MQNKYLLIFFFWLVAIPGSGQTDTIFSLKEAVAYGLSNHSDISVEKLQVAHREWQLKAEKSNYFPNVSSSADYRYNTNLPVTILPAEAFGSGQSGPQEIQMGTKNTIRAGLNIEQPLYDPVTYSEIHSSEIRRDMAKVKVSKTQKEVVLQIKRAYYRVVFNKDKLRISREVHRNHSRLLEIVSRRFRQDLASALTVEEVRQKQENQSGEVNLNLMNYHNSLKRLKLALEYPTGKKLAVADTSVFQIMDTLSMEMTENFQYRKLPEYRKLDLELKLNSENANRLSATYLPSLDAYGFIGADYYDDALSPVGNEEKWFRHSYLGVRLKIPVFRGWDKTRRLQAFKTLNHQLLQERESLAYNLQIREDILSDAVIIAMQRATIRKNKYEWALMRYQANINNFNNGLASYREVVQAGLELKIERQEYLSALLGVLMSRLDYEKLTSNF